MSASEANAQRSGDRLAAVTRGEFHDAVEKLEKAIGGLPTRDEFNKRETALAWKVLGAMLGGMTLLTAIYAVIMAVLLRSI